MHQAVSPETEKKKSHKFFWGPKPVTSFKYRSTQAKQEKYNKYSVNTAFYFISIYMPKLAKL